jgi:hypothetical protein
MECKEILKLLRRVKAEGATVERTAKGHWRIEYSGHLIVIPRNAGSHRNLLNIRADLKRIGVKL